LRELGSLQKEMRARREQAEQAAVAAASEPARPPLDEKRDGSSRPSLPMPYGATRPTTPPTRTRITTWSAARRRRDSHPQ
jgi:hypothetical protein